MWGREPWNADMFVYGHFHGSWNGYTSIGLIPNCNTGSGSVYVCKSGVSRDQVSGLVDAIVNKQFGSRRSYRTSSRYVLLLANSIRCGDDLSAGLVTQ